MGGGSDHASFLGANVPGFFWGQRGGRAVYQHTHHTQFDTFDAAIPEYQVHSSLVVALGAYGIATSTTCSRARSSRRGHDGQPSDARRAAR